MTWTMTHEEQAMTYIFSVTLIPTIVALAISLPIIHVWASSTGKRLGAQGYRPHDAGVIAAMGGAAFFLVVFGICFAATQYFWPYTPTDFSGRTADQIIHEMRQRH